MKKISLITLKNPFKISSRKSQKNTNIAISNPVLIEPSLFNTYQNSQILQNT